ncbi:MAG: AMP-binding protein, partial [Nitrospirae bacterium]|nr:AMP-binding protein [Nitrospirota bacterium]
MADKPGLQHYPHGVSPEASLREETLSTLFARSVRMFSRRSALYFFGKTLSYQECGALVERFACSLAALGVRQGDRVALCLPNCPQAVIAYFGILRAGGVVVACNPTYTQHELSSQLRDAEARVVVVLDMMYEKVQHLDSATFIVTRITDFMTTIARYIYQQRSRTSPILIPRSNHVV